MATVFSGFPHAAFDFFAGLEADNTKDWFHEHRSIYDSAIRQPAIALVDALNQELAAFAPAYVVADPRKALSRPNRDTRFSNDKRPYRTDMSVVLPRNGSPKHEVAGFFFAVGRNGVDVVGGAYMPGTAELAALRQYIVAHAARFQKVVRAIEKAGIMGTLQGEQAKRVPAGFAAAGPAADLARYKQLYFRTTIDPGVASSGALVTELSRRFRVMTPFVELLDVGLAGARVSNSSHR